MNACMEVAYGIWEPFHVLEDHYWAYKGPFGVHLGPFCQKMGKNGVRKRMRLLHGMELPTVRSIFLLHTSKGMDSVWGDLRLDQYCTCGGPFG